MDATIERDVLIRELAMAEKVTARKATLPILNHVLFVPNGNGVTLTATDTEIGMRTTMTARVAEPTPQTAPARRLLEVVKSAPAGDVRLLSTGNGVTVSAGTFRATLSALPAQDFPEVPEPDPKVPAVPLSRGLLRDVLDRTSFCTVSDDQRFWLAGVRLEMPDGALRAIASDGHRLTIAHGQRPKGWPAAEPVLVPIRAVNALGDMVLGEGDDPSLTSGAHIHFRVGPRLLAARQVDGKFPNYERIVPKMDRHIRATMDRAALTDAIHRAMMFNESKHVTFAFALTGVHLTAASQEVGAVDDDLAAEYDGPTATVKMNASYVMDFLEAVETPRVALYIAPGDKGEVRTAAVWMPDGGELDYKCVMMPISF